jgi:serine/threonine protein kinase
MASASGANAVPQLPPIDLRPYGLNLVLDSSLSQAEFEARLTKDLVMNKVRADDKRFVFSDPVKGSEYSNPRTLGEGGYGAVTECTNANQCRQVAIKKVFFNNKTDTPEIQLANFLKECILQIILIEVSKPKGLTGVPDLYKIGISDEETPTSGFMISELMDGTLDRFLDNRSEEEKDVIVTDALVQVADILEFFQRTVQFNHRDLHSKNVMYKTVERRPVYRIIDFGFSCLRWNQLQIQTNTYKFRSCFKAGRDLAHLTYELRHYAKLSKRLKVWILLLSMAPLMEWKSSYDYFNIPETPFDPASYLTRTRPSELRTAVKQLPYYKPSDVPDPSVPPYSPLPPMPPIPAPAAPAARAAARAGTPMVRQIESIFAPIVPASSAAESPINHPALINLPARVNSEGNSLNYSPSSVLSSNPSTPQIGLPGVLGGYKRRRTGNRKQRKTRKQIKKRKSTRRQIRF